MKFVAIILLNFLIATNTFAAKTSFSKNEIVFPLGKNEITKFLDLLKDPTNQSVVELKKGTALFNEIPKDNSALFTLGSETYLLYFDDVNNDGKKEYLLTFIHSGSGDYSGIKGAYALDNGKLTNLKLQKVISPKEDMSTFHLFLANPFVVRVNGKTYLRFQDERTSKNIFTYFWKDSEFKKVNL
jgi:hypothetical protein